MKSVKFAGYIGKWHRIQDNIVTNPMKGVAVYSQLTGTFIPLEKNDKLTLWEHDEFDDETCFLVTFERDGKIEILDDDWYESLDLWITEAIDYALYVE